MINYEPIEYIGNDTVILADFIALTSQLLKRYKNAILAVHSYFAVFSGP